MNAPAFIFDSYRFDDGVLTLKYRYDGAEEFIETITFPKAFANVEAAQPLFKLIFLLAGVSYFKAEVPDLIKADGIDIDTAAFLSEVYELGLGEFAYKNNLKLRGKIKFPVSVQKEKPAALTLSDRFLVPVGGGKDSIVTLEALKDKNITLFALGGVSGPAQPIADTIKVSGLPHIYVSRVLSPKLIEMNKAGAYNGHVPITAILSAIALACAVLYDFKAVVMSNEQSASTPNFDDVNHQYSKSLEFEQDLSAWISEHVSPDLKYFSYLRSISEIDIARRFAKLDKYHGVFRSCNTAFKQDEAARGKKWCCNCPKCRFVYLALAPFMKKDRLVSIFGTDMLNDAAQTQGFAELSGVSAYKPFECVGEVEESAAALKALSTMPEWQDDVVVKALVPHVKAGSLEDFLKPDEALRADI